MCILGPLQSSDEKLVLCLRDWLLPFVSRCEKESPGSRRRLLLEFLTEVAKENLAPCAQVFEHSTLEVSNCFPSCGDMTASGDAAFFSMSVSPVPCGISGDFFKDSRNMFYFKRYLVHGSL